MSARSKARKRALDLLYAADIRDVPVAQLLGAEATRAASEPDRLASWLYAREIVDGVIEHHATIDDLIRTHSRGWSLERMPNVDRAILRIGTWELLYAADVPAPVVIAEAVTSAGSLSTDESPGFVNGVLAAIAHTLDTGPEPRPQPAS